MLFSQVDEIKHYMHGLTQIHLHNKGVVYKVTFAEDVLFNEVRLYNSKFIDYASLLYACASTQAMVYLLQCRFDSISSYKQAIECHQKCNYSMVK